MLKTHGEILQSYLLQCVLPFIQQMIWIGAVLNKRYNIQWPYLVFLGHFGVQVGPKLSSDRTAKKFAYQR